MPLTFPHRPPSGNPKPLQTLGVWSFGPSKTANKPRRSAHGGAENSEWKPQQLAVRGGSAPEKGQQSTHRPAVHSHSITTLARQPDWSIHVHAACLDEWMPRRTVQPHLTPEHRLSSSMSTLIQTVHSELSHSRPLQSNHCQVPARRDKLSRCSQKDQLSCTSKGKMGQTHQRLWAQPKLPGHHHSITSYPPISLTGDLLQPFRETPTSVSR